MRCYWAVSQLAWVGLALLLLASVGLAKPQDVAAKLYAHPIKGWEIRAGGFHRQLNAEAKLDGDVTNKLKPDTDENPIEEEHNLDISKEDVKALGLKHDMPSDDDDEDNTNVNGLAGSLKNLGLTDQELAELKKMEDESNAGEERTYNGKKDRRHIDAAPPPGMVAPERKFGLDADRPPAAPHAPHQPRAEDHVQNGDASKEQDELRAASRAKAREADELRAELEKLKKDLISVKQEASDAKFELGRSKERFHESLESQKQQYKNEKAELQSAIIERKRAFDELYEEKQVLGQILEEEQKTLHELQEKIQHPDLGVWIRDRARRAAILMETPETDAMKFYAKKYMAPKVTKMRHRLELLEKRVEKSVDHLLPAKYGGVVAIILSIGLIGFPMFVTMSTVWTVTKSVSLRQYVLLGNVFLTAFSSGLCIAGLILQQDPLQTLYEASESIFIVLQLATAIAFPIFVGVIFCAVLKSRDQEDLFVFGCELVFYVLVGFNYRARVWRPAMLGENIETSRMMYVVYVIDFLSMTALTISSAKVDRPRMPSFGGDAYEDIEAAQTGGKVTAVTESSSLGSARSSLSAIGNGLMKAARVSENSSGKEE